MNNGSTINLNLYQEFPTIANTISLSGSTNIGLGFQNPDDRKTRTFTGAITGSGSLSLTSTKRVTAIFSNTGNNFAGGITSAGSGGGILIVGAATGSLGARDIAAGAFTSVQLGATDAVSAASSLHFDNAKSTAGAAATKLILDTGTTNTVSALFLNGTPVNAGTYTTSSNLSYDGGLLISGGGTLIVLGTSVAPQITSITSIGGGVWELTLKANPNTAFEFRSSTTLNFNPGALVENLTHGDPGDAGTISGTNNNVLTTDGSGVGKVRLMLSGDPADFVRAQSIP